MSGFCTVKRDEMSYDQRLVGLSDAAFRLHTYLWQGFGQNLCGLRRFVLGEAQVWTGWEPEKARAAFDELMAAGMVVYDEDLKLCFVPLALEHSPISGVNAIKGALKVLEGLPDSPVLRPVLEHLLAQLPPEAREMETRAGRGGKAGEAAAKTVRELSGLAESLMARLKSCTPPGEGEGTRSAPGAQGEGSPLGGGGQGVKPAKLKAAASGKKATPPVEGVPTPLGGGSGKVKCVKTDTTICSSISVLAPQYIENETPLGGGREGVPSPWGGGVHPVGRGSRACARVGARARAPETYPEPETLPPLNAPPQTPKPKFELKLVREGREGKPGKGRGWQSEYAALRGK